MGLLRIPDKYNPPGNGKRDMERPIYANKKERGLLMMLGGSGKMTKHGIRSFSYEDSHPGSDYGSREGGAQSGDTSGRSGNANGGSGNSRTSLFSALTRPKVAMPNRWLPPVKPVAPVVAPPVAAPSIPMGMNFGSIPITPAIPSGMNFANASLPVPAAPINSVQSSFPARPSYPARNVDKYGGEGVPGGWGMQAFEGGPAASPVSSLGLQSSSSQQNPGGFSEAQFGSQKFSPGAMYSNPDQSGAALRSVVNGINLAGGSPETKVDSMLNNMGYDNPLGRAAAIGRFGVETGGFDPKVFSGKRMGDNGTAYGLAQWRGDRQAAAKDYAGQMGVNPSDIAGQAAFAGTEMANQYPKSFSQLQNAKSLADAMGGMNSYESPRGYTPGGNPANVTGYQEAMNRAQQFSDGQSSPVQMASAVPMAGPPVQQTQPTGAPDGTFWGDLYKKGAEAASVVQQQVVQPTQDQIKKYGGFERAGKLAQIAVSISKYLPGGDGLAATSGQNHDRLGAVGDVMGNSPSIYNAGTSDTQPGRGLKRNQTTPPITPVTPPPTSPAAPNWMYPQYTQAWANLPTGIGGPIWTPTPPADGIFDKPTDSKKKKKHGMLA